MPLIKKAVPTLTDEQLAAMQQCPMRSYDPSIVQEPHIYRTQEVRKVSQIKSVYTQKVFLYDGGTRCVVGDPSIVQEPHIHRTQEGQSSEQRLV